MAIYVCFGHIDRCNIKTAVLITFFHVFIVWFLHNASFVLLSGNNSQFPETKSIAFSILKKAITQTPFQIQL